MSRRSSSVSPGTGTTRASSGSTATSPTGGYAGLRAALDMGTADLIQTVKDSGLRGRGGAGFPTGMKWSFVPQDTGKPTYVIVNYDESEPGTCNNRELVERDPHRLIEGTAIAAKAIGCHTAFIYIRGEYLWQCLGARSVPWTRPTPAGYLGTGVAGSDYDLDVVLHRGAGAYICGEETALLNSLEGFRGQPRLRPPFPAVEGLYASPTVINNVETLMNVPDIVTRGADWFRESGHREVARDEDVHDQRQGRAARQLRVAHGYAVPCAARRHRRRRPRWPFAEGVHAGRVVDAAADGRGHRRAAWTTSRSPKPGRCWAPARSW